MRIPSLDGGGKLPEKFVPPRLAEPALAATIAAEIAGLHSVAFDTDGTPYLTDNAGQPGSPIEFDTDGAPYISLGA